jgi:hypothetical protein
MKIKIAIKKTDKRMSGGDRFRYYVDIKLVGFPPGSPNTINKFFELRSWCWETWGPSREVDQYHIKKEGWYDQDLSTNWSWINDQHKVRLYLASDAEAALFMLKWS